MNGWWLNLGEEVGDALKDLIVTAVWLVAIFCLSRLDHYLTPPDGMTIFAGTRNAFKLEWIFQAGEVGGVVLFVLRSLFRVASRRWGS